MVDGTARNVSAVLDAAACVHLPDCPAATVFAGWGVPLGAHLILIAAACDRRLTTAVAVAIATAVHEGPHRPADYPPAGQTRGARALPHRAWTCPSRGGSVRNGSAVAARHRRPICRGSAGAPSARRHHRHRPFGASRSHRGGRPRTAG
jgi:hypothetical protein